MPGGEGAGLPRVDELDAVTVDAAGTAIALRDPVAPLRDGLRTLGFDRPAEAVRQAFAAEVAFYLPRAHEGRDEASLAALRMECVRVFLDALDAPIEPRSFVLTFMDALRFEALPGAGDALGLLRRAGLRLACVSNWDMALGTHLERAGLASLFDVVVSSAEAGAPKPQPAPFLLALARLEAEPVRALHVGDDEVDRAGAAAAGLAFAPPPLVTLPARLGIR